MISVIIPCFNQGHYVDSAIRSVLNQTYKNYEIIVIDDGSTDNSKEIILNFGNKIHYIWQENKGLGGARNTGIRAARGEFIGLLDSDDEWKPDYLEKMYSLIQVNPSAAAYYCSAIGIDEENNNLPQLFGGPPVPPDKLYQTIIRANFIIPSTVILRKSTVLAIGLFEQEIKAIHGCEDWDLWMRIASNYSIIGTADCLVKYRIHSNTFSASPVKMQAAVKAVVEKHFGNENGEYTSWPAEKRRAYGGMYRFFTITSLQRQRDWEELHIYLEKAFCYDVSLTRDLSLFYDLILGAQPTGYRDSNNYLDFKYNVEKVDRILSVVFKRSNHNLNARSKRNAYGMASFAKGLIAYKLNLRDSSRKYLFSAIFYLPILAFNGLLISNLIKSFFSQNFLNKIKTRFG